MEPQACGCERRAREQSFADLAENNFRRDKELADKYHALNSGKWDGMMLQTHIGYTTWQQPEKDVMPEVKRVSAGASACDSRVRHAGFTDE